MKDETYLISICIPTYNGEITLAETLNSIINEIDNYNNIEIVINDDNSKDNTLKIAHEYSKRYKYISVYKNEQNLRMDRNFTITALKAKGKYVWFCGQDDILQNGVVKKAINIIDKYQDLNFIYFNYKFVDDGLTNEVMPPVLRVKNDEYYETMDEYFKNINHAPSFLPANLMKKEFWDITNYEQYYNTYYVQTGVWLENFYKGKVYVVADPSYVLCRIPLESWKNDDGAMIFGTALGNLKTYKIAYNNDKIDYNIYNNLEKRYINKYMLVIIAAKSKGMLITKEIKDNLYFIFKDKKFKLYYTVALTYMPIYMAKSLYKFGRFSRKLVKKIKNW